MISVILWIVEYCLDQFHNWDCIRINYDIYNISFHGVRFPYKYLQITEHNWKIEKSQINLNPGNERRRVVSVGYFHPIFVSYIVVLIFPYFTTKLQLVSTRGVTPLLLSPKYFTIYRRPKYLRYLSWMIFDKHVRNH